MSVTDVEIERSLNALSATLNDQRLDTLRLDRLQEIVTGALGGQPHIRVVLDPARAGHGALLRDDADAIVGIVELREGAAWHVERRGFPRAGGPTPGGGD